MTENGADDGMTLDYSILLLAVGFSVACLAVALVGFWLTARSETFFLTWAAGATICVGGVFAYGRFVATVAPQPLALGLALLMFGFALFYGSACQYRSRRSATHRIVLATVSCFALTLPPALAGFSGLALLMFNGVVAAILGLAAVEYWQARAESPRALLTMTIVCGSNAVGFALCALMLLLEGRTRLEAPPDNWAETLNLLLVTIGVVAGGAASFNLNRQRIHGHASHALDPDTGFEQDTALFHRFRRSALDTLTAVAVFEIQPVETDNTARDTDDSTSADRFAAALRPLLGRRDSVARIGPRQFVTVLPDAGGGRLETIIAAVDRNIAAPGRPRVQVHSGHAFASPLACDFASVFHSAEKAMERARRDAANRPPRAQQP